MTTYISLLRGINVGGQKSIKMDVLKSLYKNLNFDNITTYIQSGNVIFSVNEQDEKILEQSISKQIEKEFGFNVPVIVLSLKTLKKIIESNPFIQDSSKELTYLHVTFLSNHPNELIKESIFEKKQENEEIAFTENVMYLFCPNGYGKTKLNNTFLEKKLKAPTTTRNWKTVNEILKLASK